VVPPGVPADRSMLRTTYMATHTDNDLDEVLDRVKKIGKQMNLI
jgi:8-amino-7-oxononanoate synthase